MQRRHSFLAFASALAIGGCGDNNATSSPPDAQHPNVDARPDVDASPDSMPDAPTGEANLILHYAFEDSGTQVTDSSPSAKHGTLTDPSGWTADGRVGRGLAMTGANPATTYVSLPSGVLANVQDFTITFWLKLNSVSPWARVYDFGNGLADPANRFMYFSVNGFIGADHGVMASSYGGSATNEIALTSKTELPTGVWKHVAVVGQGGSRTIYIDGFPAVQTTGGPVVAPQEMEPIAQQAWLGKSRFPDPGLDGTLDEFKIYNRAFTASEVEASAWPGMDYAHWQFDENTGTTTADASGHAIPTALSAGVTWTSGRLGSAVTFAGGAGGATGPTVTLATNPLAQCTDQLTVSAWIKQDAVQPWARVFDFGSGTTSFIYLAPSDGAGMHFAMVSPHGAFDLVSPTVPFTDDEWHHVAVTVAPDGMVTLYADGAAIATKMSPAVTPADFAASTDLWLGKSRFGADPYFHGAMDELRIGCRALSADEIMNLSRP